MPAGVQSPENAQPANQELAPKINGAEAPKENTPLYEYPDIPWGETMGDQAAQALRESLKQAGDQNQHQVLVGMARDEIPAEPSVGGKTILDKTEAAQTITDGSPLEATAPEITDTATLPPTQEVGNMTVPDLPETKQSASDTVTKSHVTDANQVIFPPLVTTPNFSEQYPTPTEINNLTIDSTPAQTPVKSTRKTRPRIPKTANTSTTPEAEVPNNSYNTAVPQAEQKAPALSSYEGDEYFQTILKDVQTNKGEIGEPSPASIQNAEAQFRMLATNKAKELDMKAAGVNIEEASFNERMKDHEFMTKMVTLEGSKYDNPDFQAIVDSLQRKAGGNADPETIRKEAEIQFNMLQREKLELYDLKAKGFKVPNNREEDPQYQEILSQLQKDTNENQPSQATLDKAKAQFNMLYRSRSEAYDKKAIKGASPDQVQPATTGQNAEQTPGRVESTPTANIQTERPTEAVSSTVGETTSETTAATPEAQENTEKDSDVIRVPKKIAGDPEFQNIKNTIAEQYKNENNGQAINENELNKKAVEQFYTKAAESLMTEGKGRIPKEIAENALFKQILKGMIEEKSSKNEELGNVSFEALAKYLQERDSREDIVMEDMANLGIQDADATKYLVDNPDIYAEYSAAKEKDPEAIKKMVNRYNELKRQMETATETDKIKLKNSLGWLAIIIAIAAYASAQATQYIGKSGA